MAAVSERREEPNDGQGQRQIRIGGEELMRVVIRQSNFEKIAHKIDRLGDYQPEIVYEKAQVAEMDPREEGAIAEIEPNEKLRNS